MLLEFSLFFSLVSFHFWEIAERRFPKKVFGGVNDPFTHGLPLQKKVKAPGPRRPTHLARARFCPPSTGSVNPIFANRRFQLQKSRQLFSRGSFYAPMTRSTLPRTYVSPFAVP